MTKTKRKSFQSFEVKGLLEVIAGTMIEIKGVTGADELAYICRLTHLFILIPDYFDLIPDHFNLIPDHFDYIVLSH